VNILATGPDRIQERLEDAATILLRLEPAKDLDDLPGERRRLIGILDDLMFDQARTPGEGRIHATLARTDDLDACRIATRIYELHCALGRAYWGQHDA
jgi:hypothetical protein